MKLKRMFNSSFHPWDRGYHSEHQWMIALREEVGKPELASTKKGRDLLDWLVTSLTKEGQFRALEVVCTHFFTNHLGNLVYIARDGENGVSYIVELDYSNGQELRMKAFASSNLGFAQFEKDKWHIMTRQRILNSTELSEYCSLTEENSLITQALTELGFNFFLEE